MVVTIALSTTILVDKRSRSSGGHGSRNDSRIRLTEESVRLPVTVAVMVTVTVKVTTTVAIRVVQGATVPGVAKNKYIKRNSLSFGIWRSTPIFQRLMDENLE